MPKRKKFYDEDGNVVTPKGKKPFYKRWWFIAIVALFILSPLLSDDEEAATEVEPETEVVEAEETEPEEDVEEVEDIEEVEETADVEEEVIEESIEDAEEALEDLEDEDIDVSIEFLLTYLRNEEIGQMGSFDYDEDMNAVTYVPEDEDVANAFVFIGAGLLQEEYETFKNGFSTLSSSISDLKDVGLIILNPENTENMLLWFEDGLLLYDFAAE